MTVDPVLLFDEFAVRWARGERPDPADFLGRAGGQREQLARLLDAYLAAAPTQAPTGEDRRAVRAAVLRFEQDGTLRDLRVGAGLRRDAVVDAIVEVFALPAALRWKVKERYHELESGTLAAARIDARLAALLAKLVGTTAEALRALELPTVVAKEAFARSETAFDIALPAAAAPAAEPDEVDRLFGVSS